MKFFLKNMQQLLHKYLSTGFFPFEKNIIYNKKIILKKKAFSEQRKKQSILK